jgi:thioesterase domain-containing protein
LELVPAVPRPPRRGWDKLQHRMAELRRFSWADRRIWLTDQMARRLGLLQEDMRELNEAGALMDLPGMELLLRQAQQWQPPRYNGKVYLIRGNQNMRGYPNPAGSHGWEEHCPDLEVLSMPCNHAQILAEPHVVRIAAEIRSWLNDEARYNSRTAQI